ncbi:hypothetical protein FB645_002819 [Coemansia sp. IMI 203386]|nr:hypothetical protein FB645_002819 [Coemansia sp. IMI 203386]
MSSATSAEVHVAADVPVTDSVQTRSIIDNTDRACSSIPISPSQDARMGGDAIFDSNNHSGSSVDKNSKSSGNEDNGAGNTDADGRTSASSFFFAPASTPQTTRAETMSASVHSMPNLDTPSIHADKQTAATATRGDTATQTTEAAAVATTLGAGANNNNSSSNSSMMDLDYEVHSASPFANFDDGASSVQKSAFRQSAAREQSDLSEASPIPNYLFSHSATVSSSCSSDPPTNSHSPLPSLSYPTRMSILAAPASNKQAIVRSFDLVARGADVSSSSRAGSVAAIAASVAASPESSRQSPLVSFNTSSLTPDGNAVQSLSFASTTFTSATSTALPLTEEQIEAAITTTAILTAATSASVDIPMDSDSEPDNELSPVQRAQRVSGSFALSEQPSPQTIQRSEARVAPIRSLAEALTLSPRGYEHLNSDNSGSYAALQTILDRVEDVYRCCTHLAQVQEQNTRQIQSLEKAMKAIAGASSSALSPAPPLSAASESGPTSAYVTSSLAAVKDALFSEPTEHSSITESDVLLTSPSRHRQATLVSDASNVAEAEPSEHLMHQGRDSYVSPQRLRHDKRQQQQQQQQHSMSRSAGYKSPTRFATSVHRHHPHPHPHQHQHSSVCGAPYSSRTSPSTSATESVAVSMAATAQSTGILAYSPPRSHPYHHYQQQQQQHKGLVSATSPTGHRFYRHDSGSRAHRGSSHPQPHQQQQQQQPSTSWTLHQQQQPMQPIAHGGGLHGAGNSSSSRVSLPLFASVPPMTETEHEERVHPQQQLISQHVLTPHQQQHSLPPPPPHPASVPVPGTSTSVFGHNLRSATSSSTGMHMLYSAQQQQASAGAGGTAGYPRTRAKRPRVAEGVSDDYSVNSGSGENIASAAGSAFRLPVQLPQPHYRQTHQHGVQGQGQGQPHAPLPPIRTSSDLHPRAANNPGVDGSTAMHLSRPGVLTASSSRVIGGGGSHTRSRDSKGKSTATGDTEQQQQQQQGASATEVVRGNPDAQPTTAWLASQRHYKIALLHLLTLESFYPSDVAMLNMFRSQGDFTNEQIETNGAALLSWARSWLRYNRNAVLRSTLETKSKSTLSQLAEALQHDLHAETDFTTPQNLRRCALLRLIFFQWQAINKLGTKSQSLYRDYEIRLREIEALGTVEEQETEWNNIIQEEHSRRLALIRENRGSGGSAILPKPEAQSQSQTQSQPQSQVQQQQQHHQISGPSLSAGSSSMPPRGGGVSGGHSSVSSLARRQSMDWPAYPAAESSTSGQQPQYSQQQHFQQRHLVQPQRFSMQQQQQMEYQYRMSLASGHGNPGLHGSSTTTVESHTGSGSGRQAAIGKDDDSEISVKMSPEPQ